MWHCDYSITEVKAFSLYYDSQVNKQKKEKQTRNTTNYFVIQNHLKKLSRKSVEKV